MKCNKARNLSVIVTLRAAMDLGCIEPKTHFTMHVTIKKLLVTTGVYEHDMANFIT